MRLLLFITFLSICFSGSSQTAHTTFLKLKTTDFNQNYPELPFGRIIVVDNQLDSTPISIQGGKNQIFEKFRLDSPVSRTLAAFLSEEFKQVLSGPNVLTILMNECRFYTTAGQIRERGGKLRKVNSAKLMKINLTLFTQGSETYKVNPVYVGTLDRFFKVEKVDDIPRIFQNACIGAILLSAHKRTQASTINIHGLQGATISMDDDIDLVLQRKSFDSLTKGESPFIKTVLAYGKPITDSIRIFQCFQDLKRQIATTKKDSLVYDEKLGLVKYLKTGRNRNLIKNCWGVLYGQSFYVRFNRNYFFEIESDKKSAMFKVPDYMSDMYTLQSMPYGDRGHLNRSLHNHGQQMAGSPTVFGTLATAGVGALTESSAKSSSRMTLLNSSSYSLKYRYCRIDPISGDIIYDFGSKPH